MYKNALCGLSCVFFGVANYWGQEINIILPLLGFLGVNLQWQVPTSLLVDQHNSVISAYGLPTQLLSQSNQHSGHPGTVEGTSLSFISHTLCIFIRILIFCGCCHVTWGHLTHYHMVSTALIR